MRLRYVPLRPPRLGTKIIPAAAERSTFVLVTGVIVASMMWLWQPLPGNAWVVEGVGALVPGVVREAQIEVAARRQRGQARAWLRRPQERD